ncbi:MAG: SH3 domain-containing protein [Thermomicrobiales bacterium]
MNLTHTEDGQDGQGEMVARSRASKATDRRPYRLITFVTLFAVLFAGFFAIPATVGASSEHTIDDVNFRIGPGTNYDAMTVIPAGAQIEVLGDPQNGFYPIQYGDATGYASGDYLSIGGGGDSSSGSDNGSGVSNDGATGTAFVIDGALNLRSGASSSSSVITVMPGDAQVELTGETSNGFLGVVYNGTSGWAFADYISQSASAPQPTEVPVTPAPTEAPVDPGNGNGETDIVSIIYAAADKYGQPREDMLRVAMCESNLDPGAVNPASGTSGLFQFMPSTFASTPFAGENIFDPYANANAAGWMWSVGRRNEWECQ